MAATEERPIGFGNLKRKEDPRLIRGQGTFVDDVVLPGMLHGAALRSPLAHAKIVSIDTSAALQHPKVRAVITGKDLEAQGLAWMPTLSRRHAGRARHRQGALPGPGGRVRRRRRPLRRARRARADRRRVRAARRRRRPEAARSTPTRPSSATTRRARPTTTSSTGRPATRPQCDARLRRRRHDRSSCRTSRSSACTPRRSRRAARSPTTTPSRGKLQLWCTTQAPHAHRTLYALVAGLPEHKIQVIAPDIGGGFGNKVPIYPGYVCAVVASIVSGHPVKWVEDRTENLTSTGFARDYLMSGKIAADKDGRIRALRVDTLADHGAFNATAQPSKYPAGFFHIFTGSYDLEAAYCTVKGVYTNKAPGRRGLPLLVPDHRGGVLRRADGRPARRRAGDGPGRAADEELHPARAVPVHDADGLDVRLRRLRRRRWTRRCGSPATTSCAPSRRRRASAAS